MTQRFSRFFTGTGAIRQDNPIVNGKRTVGSSAYTTIEISQMVGVTDDEARRQVRRPELGTPLEIAQVFAGSSAMMVARKGDKLVIGSREYPIRHIEYWPLAGEQLVRIIVEKQDK